MTVPFRTTTPYLTIPEGRNRVRLGHSLSRKKDTVVSLTRPLDSLNWEWPDFSKTVFICFVLGHILGFKRGTWGPDGILGMESVLPACKANGLPAELSPFPDQNNVWLHFPDWPKGYLSMPVWDREKESLLLCPYPPAPSDCCVRTLLNWPFFLPFSMMSLFQLPWLPSMEDFTLIQEPCSFDKRQNLRMTSLKKRRKNLQRLGCGLGLSKNPPWRASVCDGLGRRRRSVCLCSVGSLCLILLWQDDVNWRAQLCDCAWVLHA